MDKTSLLIGCWTLGIAIMTLTMITQPAEPVYGILLVSSAIAGVTGAIGLLIQASVRKRSEDEALKALKAAFDE